MIMFDLLSPSLGRYFACRLRYSTVYVCVFTRANTCTQGGLLPDPPSLVHGMTKFGAHRFTQRLMDLEEGPAVYQQDSSRSVMERLAERISKEDAEGIRDKCKLADR
jgi:hypothetical protein